MTILSPVAVVFMIIVTLYEAYSSIKLGSSLTVKLKLKLHPN